MIGELIAEGKIGGWGQSQATELGIGFVPFSRWPVAYGRSREMPVRSAGVAASLLTCGHTHQTQDRGSLEDAGPYKEVGISARYQRFRIAPFALVTEGFTQL